MGGVRSLAHAAHQRIDLSGGGHAEVVMLGASSGGSRPLALR
jgi:hypothetical protein